MKLQAAVSSMISDWPATQTVPPALQPVFIAWANECANAVGKAYIERIIELSQQQLKH
jgi:hypothetical protein